MSGFFIAIAGILLSFSYFVLWFFLLHIIQNDILHTLVVFLGFMIPIVLIGLFCNFVKLSPDSGAFSKILRVAAIHSMVPLFLFSFTYFDEKGNLKFDPRYKGMMIILSLFVLIFFSILF